MSVSIYLQSFGAAVGYLYANEDTLQNMVVNFVIPKTESVRLFPWETVEFYFYQPSLTK
jgi:hypothetical protein